MTDVYMIHPVLPCWVGWKKWEQNGRTSSSLLARLRAFFFTLKLLSCLGNDSSVVSSTSSTAGFSLSCLRGTVLPPCGPEDVRGSEGVWSVWVLVPCILEWRVSSSEREKRFSHEGKVQTKGFSLVCVRIWRVCRKGLDKQSVASTTRRVT